jgi:hypothetical protein
VLRHLSMLCASYVEAGYEPLMVTATVEDDDYRKRLLDAAGADEHVLVRLEAEPAS